MDAHSGLKREAKGSSQRVVKNNELAMLPEKFQKSNSVRNFPDNLFSVLREKLMKFPLVFVYFNSFTLTKTLSSTFSSSSSFSSLFTSTATSKR